MLKTFNRIFFTIASFIPIPGLQGLMKFATAILNMSLTYLDEVILAYYMRSGSDNPWKSSEDAIGGAQGSVGATLVKDFVHGYTYFAKPKDGRER